MRYIIGIDLGTTNSCVSYVDSQDPKLSIQPLKIPQLIAPGYVEARPTLPSFYYLSDEQEWPSGALSLPWKKNKEHFVGHFAQSHGSKVPTRLVQSAKSWLCHSAANRKDKILPFEGDAEKRISPVEATIQYLAHIKNAWNHQLAKSNIEAEFDQQEIILTVPASFDEVARRLTAEAAKMAGYINLTLLEEPQAAFYSWISLHENRWQEMLKAGDSILVCDVGGGTTDFSLIEVQDHQGKLEFMRKAVGEHLLLGGDNMDAAIAHYAEEKLFKDPSANNNLQTVQWLQLKHQARLAKETLLDNSQQESDSFTVLLKGTGSSVIKGSLSTQLQKEEISQLLLRGFFGQYTLEDALKIKKSTGFRTMGLPYEEEPSIIKHLAAFLKRAQLNKALDYVLFNGGAMKPSLFQEAILKSIIQWFPESDPQPLESISLDLAVARGAAYYGKVRRGLGVRIGGGIPKAYYLGIEIKKADGLQVQQALTLLPRGSEEGASYASSQTFMLRPNTPVAFNLYTSQVRLNDQQGDLVEIDSKELQPLPPIHTILRLGKKQIADQIPVQLHITLTSIGTLDLWLQSKKSEHRWSLEFQLRSTEGQENNVSLLDAARSDESFDASYLQPAQEYIKQLFNKGFYPDKVMETVEKMLDQPRRDWSLSILRGLCTTLLSVAEDRKINGELEVRWWNMMGFFLRPGYGYPLDDFRIKEIWKIILGDIKSSKFLECQIQHWICFRRIAGGLNKGQQMQLANEILTTVLPNKSSQIVLKAKSDLYPYTEKMRALASFELLDNVLKRRIGEALLSRLVKGEASSSDYWAMGRIGARHLIYGSAANVIPQEICSVWIQKLLKLPISDLLAQVFTQLARKTDHREINVPQVVVEQILAAFVGTQHQERLQMLLTQPSALTMAEQEQVYGDKLPAGLVLEFQET
jgi:molecular chaperone DnaK (HSP70)